MTRCFSFLYALVWPFFNLVYPGKAIGRGNIPEGGALICSNHVKMSDPFFISFAFGRKHPLNIMAKEELRHAPIIGRILDWYGIIWVKRGKSDVGAIKAAMKVLKGNKKLLIFPEGTRHEEIGDGKSGAVMLAIRTNVPVVPIYLPQKRAWFRRTPVVIGEPYYPFTEQRKATSEDYRAATEELMLRISNLKELAT